VGRKGFLKTNYWFLEYNEAKAKLHLRDNVIKTIKSLEDWFGPYPFYEDSYKIVESPYLGMEHQSNIAYGNNYLNGYAGRDLSNSGWGLKWDFIVVHETAHEWYGNSITAYDVADNWIHEGFASYAEVLHTETFFGKDAGNSYCLGVRKSILNDKPIIGVYNVRQEGSGDMYNKGSNIIHMIRYLLDDDIKFKSLLNVISTQFYHQCITSKQLEDFIMSETKLDLNAFFNQYLRTTQIPKLEYRIKGKLIEYRFINIVNGFTAPIKIYVNQDSITLNPNNNWQKLKLNERVRKTEISFDNRMYVETIRVR
jgi:aminopeptidase N